MTTVMNRIALHRLCAVLLALSLLAGLPMQGIAMTSQMSVAASGELPMPDRCPDCADEPAISTTCPIVFCIGLSAVLVKEAEVVPLPFELSWATRSDTGFGVVVRPDPHPPRTVLYA